MPKPSVADEIASFDRLRADGFLTPEEFATQRDALLAVDGPLIGTELTAGELTKLAALVTAGTITRADFDRQKAALLWTETPPAKAETPGPKKRTTPPSAVPAPIEPSPKTHSKRKWGIAALVGLVVVIVAVSSSSKPKTTPKRPPSTSTSGVVATTRTARPKVTVATVATTTIPAGPGIGQVAKDGDFAFVVKGMSCGAAAAAAVNSGGYGETVPAGAQECLVTMTVTDDKSTAQTFFDSNQYGYDAKGHQYSADSNASLYLAGDKDDTQVNPGITITAVVPFQIPATDKLTSLQLHDSAFSGGVTVRL